MNREDRQKALKKKEEDYYSLTWDLSSIRNKLNSLKKQRGHSSAFKVLMGAIDLMEYQINDDHNRYKRRIAQSNITDDLSFMQKALNREKVKTAKLEKQIEEAKTSSGLFIDFVRGKLNLK